MLFLFRNSLLITLSRKASEPKAPLTILPAPLPHAVSASSVSPFPSAALSRCVYV